MASKRRRHTPEQIIRKLREADQLAGEGQDVAAVCKQLEVSETTLHRWRAPYGGLKATDVKRLKELEEGEPEAEADRRGTAARESGAEGDRAGKLVSPSRRHAAVVMLQQRLGLSERRACRIAGQHRSTQRHQPLRSRDRDDAVRARLRKLSAEHPRWGYRLAWGALREEGWEVNRKKIQRLWREEGLRVPRRKRKRLRVGDSTVPAVRLRSQRPNHVWALDFQFDTTVDGRTVKLLHVVDEHTREALAIEVARSIDADHTVRVLDRIVATGRRPELLRSDNGPELTANAAAGLVPLRRQRPGVHRARLALGEPVRRIVWKPRP
jgi:transposase InsO family protein